MRKKISIIGAGRVGSTAAQICAYKELGDVVLWNRTPEIAKGIALDLMEAAPIEGFDIDIVGTGDLKDTKNSEVVAVTAGAQRKPGQTREELVNINSEIIKSLAPHLVKFSPKCVLIIITNPLDAMVYLSYKISKLPRERVIGMAGILDSSRFASFIAKELKVAVEDISAPVIGSHGEFMIPLPAHTDVNGVPLTQLMKKEKINQLIERTRNAGAEILELEKESSAYFAPAASLTQMIEAIVKDKHRILPCSAYLDGEYGIKGIFMGVPVKLGSKGIERIIEFKLTDEEKKNKQKTVEGIKSLINQLKI